MEPRIADLAGIIQVQGDFGMPFNAGHGIYDNSIAHKAPQKIRCQVPGV
jgi:hypothetical protein